MTFRAGQMMTWLTQQHKRCCVLGKGDLSDCHLMNQSKSVISAATATSAALGVVKPDGTIITVAGGAITVPKATNAAFGVVEVDGTTITAAGGVISAAGGAGLVSGACFLLAMPAQGVSSNVNWENTTLTNAWSGLSLNYFPASGAWKIKLLFTAGSPQIGNMVILRTAINSLVVIDSTSVTIGGVSNPTLVTPELVETDAVALALDNTHNYYFMIFFSNVGANSTVGVAELFTSVAYAPVTSFDPSGNQTGVGNISNASSHANVLMLGLYVP